LVIFNARCYASEVLANGPVSVRLSVPPTARGIKQCCDPSVTLSLSPIILAKTVRFRSTVTIEH